ncbi:MAG: uroporphyrinogen-III synthase [Bacteroidota bacterium]
MSKKNKKSIKASSKKVASKAPKASSGKSKKVVAKAKSSAKPAKKIQKPLVKKTVAKKITKKSIPAKTRKVAIKKVAAKKKITAKAPIAKKVVKKTVKVVKKAIAKKAPAKVAPVVTAKKATLPVAPKTPAPAKIAAPKAENTTSAEKFVKVGVKTKKQLVAVTPQPVIEVSDYPKNRVKTLLISQPKPENDKNPYYDLAKKYNLIETFRQFIKIEGIPVKDFRSQRIDILEHKAVILTSRMAVDHYFRMCNEMRVTVPESMKYFCINEATAYYLQKYIQYRKRKIFFGHQTIQDLVDVIRKNREERFLLPAADVHKEQICDFLDAINIKYTKAVMYRTVSADLSDIKNLNDYDILAFFTPAGINSLKHNFPNFKQGNTRIACFGAATANTLKKHGYRLDIYAPNPKNPSMSGALDEYIREANKR